MKLIACLFAVLLLGNSVATPILAASASVPSVKLSSQDCGDFLAKMRKKPAHLTYVGCTYAPDQQGKPLQATYQVSGRFAAEIEASLMKTTGLQRLQHLCCHWESQTSQFRDSMGREFLISMFSEETIVGGRNEWRFITMFEVTVETFTEDI